MPLTWERAKKIVETEEEIPGQIPQSVLDLILVDPAESMRAAVRATKKSILKRMAAEETKENLKEVLGKRIEKLLPPPLQMVKSPGCMIFILFGFLFAATLVPAKLAADITPTAMVSETPVYVNVIGNPTVTSTPAVPDVSFYVSLNGVADFTIQHGMLLDQNTVGFVFLPEVRAGYRFTDRVGVFIDGANFGLQAALGGGSTGNQQPTGRNQLRGSNNYVSAGMDFRTQIPLLGNLKSDDFLAGLGLGNFQVDSTGTVFDYGPFVYVGVSVEWFPFYTFVRNQ